MPITNLQALADHWTTQAGSGVVAIALTDLSTDTEYLVNADVSFHPASTIKVPIMMEVYRQTAAGRFSLDDPIPVSNAFSSIMDGKPFTLNLEDDAEQSLYELVGQEAPIRSLVEKMITRSSNLGTNLLIQLVGVDCINAFSKELGAPEVVVARLLYDTRAFDLGVNNQATARGLMRLLVRLAKGEVVSTNASQEMIAVLKRQEFNEGLPARLPEGTVVAHKTGWIERIYHDFGIIYPLEHPPYVLAVMTRGFDDVTLAHACVTDISHQVYQAIVY